MSFIGGSITSSGAQEVHELGNKKNPLHKLFIADRPDGTMEPTMNLLLNHGVRSTLEYRMVSDFVCIPRPIERAATPDGGPLRCRLRHEVPYGAPVSARNCFSHC